MLKDRVFETSQTTGTGNFTLDGAVTGAVAFLDSFAADAAVFYVIEDTTTGDWELGNGIIRAGNILERNPRKSSNGGSPVDFQAGTKNVFCQVPADALVYEDASGNAQARKLTVTTNLTVSGLFTLGPENRRAKQITLTLNAIVNLTTSGFADLNGRTAFFTFMGASSYPTTIAAAFFSSSTLQLAAAAGSLVAFGGTTNPDVSGKLNIWVSAGDLMVKNRLGNHTALITQHYT